MVQIPTLAFSYYVNNMSWFDVALQAKKTKRDSARIRPSGEMNRICLSSLEHSGSYRLLFHPSSGAGWQQSR